MGAFEYFSKTIQDTLACLKEKPEWRDRYAGIAEDILDNEGFISEVRGKFHEWSPFKFYLLTNDARDAYPKRTGTRSVTFSMRYLGQQVAKLTATTSIGVQCQSDQIQLVLSTSGSDYDFDEANKKYFECEIQLKESDWNGDDAKVFRDRFRRRHSCDTKVKSPEHRIESLLLTEFSKPETPKALIGIQPVRIAKVRFGMPIPLNAHNRGVVTHSLGPGGIDILARFSTPGQTNLCIIEVKDENIRDEPATDAIEQAIKYTVFIHQLLRSDAGAD